jgi:hypothetical protein
MAHSVVTAAVYGARNGFSIMSEKADNWAGAFFVAHRLASSQA